MIFGYVGDVPMQECLNISCSGGSLVTKGRLFLCYGRELKNECFSECGERRGLQGVHRFHKFPSMNSPSTALGVKCHGSFILVTAVSCCEHSQIKLYLVKTPLIELFMGLSCSSKR